jgi:hypothetical protein
VDIPKTQWNRSGNGKHRILAITMEVQGEENRADARITIEQETIVFGLPDGSGGHRMNRFLNGVILYP